MANKIPIINAGLRTYDREKRLWAAMHVNIDLCTFRHTYTRCTYTHTHSMHVQTSSSTPVAVFYGFAGTNSSASSVFTIDPVIEFMCYALTHSTYARSLWKDFVGLRMAYRIPGFDLRIFHIFPAC